MRRAVLGAVALVSAALASPAEARQAYCYASVMPPGDKLSRALMPGKVYVTPVFQSDADVFLLEALFQETVPEAGLATCVTDEDEPNLNAAWQNFVDSSKADHLQIQMEPVPTE